MQETIRMLKVEGMSCMGCVRTVERALTILPGVKQAEVDLERGSARVTYDSEQISLDQLVHAVNKSGYQAAAIA